MYYSFIPTKGDGSQGSHYYLKRPNTTRHFRIFVVKKTVITWIGETSSFPRFNRHLPSGRAILCLIDTPGDSLNYESGGDARRLA